MKDFTLSAYIEYLKAIKLKYDHILRFDEFMKEPGKYDSFCLIRHDVDRKPDNALTMARAEHDLQIRSTYYIRAKKHTFIPEILLKIQDLGHEIGYHYESLSDTNGDVQKALIDFRLNLEKFRQIVPIKTVSMHGRPFKPYDNRDLWRSPENHNILLQDINILGEVYLDIDYSDIAYVTDTGRNWSSTKSNKRDKVHSNIKVDFKNGAELMQYLRATPHKKFVFQIHPERWTDDTVEWLIDSLKDGIINMGKTLLR